MRLVHALLPIAGLVVATSVPIARYEWRDQRERVAIDVVRQAVEAQRRFRERTGAYATSPASLTTLCGDVPAWLSADIQHRLHEAGYYLELRAAEGAHRAGPDCHGLPLADDYYVSVAPLASDGVPRQAFASRGDGHIYLFYDGIAPLESDMAGGLATRVEDRERFVIP